MMSHSHRILAAAAALIVLCGTPRALQATISTAETTPDGKVCRVFFGDVHYHYGSSAAEATRSRAQAVAVKSWADFTAFEYGKSWANFNRAKARSVVCKQSGGTWSCEAKGQPCRR